MKIYRYNQFRPPQDCIDEMEAIKETDKTFWVNSAFGRIRFRKDKTISTDKAEVVKYIRHRKEEHLIDARNHVRRCETDLVEFNKLYPPEAHDETGV